MDTSWLPWLLLALLIFTIYLFIYSGLFASVEVIARPSPAVLKDILLAYKTHVGEYGEVGPLFSKAASINSSLKMIGVYLDNPEITPKEKCRSLIGVIIPGAGAADAADAKKAYKEQGYKFFQLPYPRNVVHTKFPNRTFLSIYIAAWRVYSSLSDYIWENKLDGRPFIEIYHENEIEYFAPLDGQDEFYPAEFPAISSKKSVPTAAREEKAGCGEVFVTTEQVVKTLSATPRHQALRSQLSSTSNISEVEPVEPFADTDSSMSSFEELDKDVFNQSL